MYELIVTLCLAAAPCVDYAPYDPMPREECVAEASRIREVLVSSGHNDFEINCTPLPDLTHLRWSF